MVKRKGRKRKKEKKTFSSSLNYLLELWGRRKSGRDPGCRRRRCRRRRVFLILCLVKTEEHKHTFLVLFPFFFKEILKKKKKKSSTWINTGPFGLVVLFFSLNFLTRELWIYLFFWVVTIGSAHFHDGAHLCRRETGGSHWIEHKNMLRMLHPSRFQITKFYCMLIRPSSRA